MTDAGYNELQFEKRDVPNHDEMLGMTKTKKKNSKLISEDL